MKIVAVGGSRGDFRKSEWAILLGRALLTRICSLSISGFRYQPNTTYLKLCPNVLDDNLTQAIYDLFARNKTGKSDRDCVSSGSTIAGNESSHHAGRSLCL